MFSKLLKSSARQSLLELFTKNSRQKYYLRELAGIINYSPGSLKRELTSLLDDGLITSERMGNLRFFMLNTKSPLLKELKAYLEGHPQYAQNTQAHHATQAHQNHASSSELHVPESIKKQKPASKPKPTLEILRSAIQESATESIEDDESNEHLTLHIE